MHCSDILTFLVERRVEKAADNINNAEDNNEDSSNEYEDINEEENKGELKDLMDQDLETDEGDLDWDEYSLEDTGAIDFNSDPNDPDAKDEVMLLRGSIEKMYTCQPQQYNQLIGTVGTQYQTSIQTAVEKYDAWIADFTNKIQKVLENHTDGNVKVEFN